VETMVLWFVARMDANITHLCVVIENVFAEEIIKIA